MAVEVVMPKFGLTMTEGTIQKWFISEGDKIQAGDAVFEVETEKVLYEVEAAADGTIAKLLYPLEAVVTVGLPVAVIAEAGEDIAEIVSKYADAPGALAAAAPTTAPVAATAPATESRGRVPVTPAARKLAKVHNIGLASMTGTGPRGRITREDVQKVIDTGGQAAPAAPAAATLAEGRPPCCQIPTNTPGSLREARGDPRSRFHKSKFWEIFVQKIGNMSPK